MPETPAPADSAVLSAEEVQLLRCVVADYRAGRRIARFVFRLFLALGAAGAALTGTLSGWHSWMSITSHIVPPPPAP